MDVAGILLWGDVPRATWEVVFGWLATVGFCGLLGIVFAYLLPFLGQRYYIFKGTVFGIASWFIIYAIGALYKVPLLVKSTPQTSLTHLFAATIFGAAMGYFWVWADRRVVAEEPSKDNSTKFSVPAPGLQTI